MQRNVSSSISYHGVTGVRASSTHSPGAPLTLELRGREGCKSEVHIFTNDQKWTDALIKAINSVSPVLVPVPDDAA